MSEVGQIAVSPEDAGDRKSEQPARYRDDRERLDRGGPIHHALRQR